MTTDPTYDEARRIDLMAVMFRQARTGDDLNGYDTGPVNHRDMRLARQFTQGRLVCIVHNGPHPCPVHGEETDR
jgi:hypothetical protein